VTTGNSVPSVVCSEETSSGEGFDTSSSGVDMVVSLVCSTVVLSSSGSSVLAVVTLSTSTPPCTVVTCIPVRGTNGKYC
jgi:hypothetical protein